MGRLARERQDRVLRGEGETRRSDRMVEDQNPRHRRTVRRSTKPREKMEKGPQDVTKPSMTTNLSISDKRSVFLKEK